MGIDYSQLGGGGNKPIIHPRDIFQTTHRGNQLWDIQTEVLNSWFDVRDENDNVIKLNVGSGKTLVGLLLLQSSLNEGKGPALFVSPNKQLLEQVKNEAKKFGIEFTEEPKDPDYAACEKICIINIYRLFNGKSIFGVNANRIEIGTVIIDDAHACISTIIDQFRVKLQNSDEAYQEIFAILAEDIRGYNEAHFLDVESGDPRSYVEVPFWSWNTHHSDILNILHKHKHEESLEFVYPFVSDILKQCRCVIGGGYLEIEPFFPNTDLVPSFRRAKRRIYMTATLADDSVIFTHFGADSSKIITPIVPVSSQSIGDRMILMPQALNTAITLTDIRELLIELSKEVNVVVIVPSDATASKWKDSASQILSGHEKVVEGVEKLRTNSQPGLTVIVNRYDGIDLPGDACRVLVIADLPEVTSYSDRLDNGILGDASINLKRQIERIEQGMGRGIRSNDDYCAVLLIGPKLISSLISPKGKKMLTSATKAQLDLSNDLAKQLAEKPSIEYIKEVIWDCLNRHPDWVQASRRVLLTLPTDDKAHIDESKIAFRGAFDMARAGDYQQAVKILDETINSVAEEPTKAWLLSKKAIFQHNFDAEGADKTLRAAHKMEPSVLKPISGTSYKKIAPTSKQQADALIEHHANRFLGSIDMKLFADHLCQDLQFESVKFERFEAAVNDLAWFLGIASQRPENDHDKGPDNLWALPDSSFLIIECKNETSSKNRIFKDDARQLSLSVDWFKEKYPSSKFEPIIIHPNHHLDQKASPIDRMRVIDSELLEKIRRNLREFATQMENPDVAKNSSEVAKRLNQFNFIASNFVEHYSKPVK